ncbi:unnamed protein product, partial [Mesorhabditis belari]|uniref:F-box domain-containing protein n=1 Tax=Mesorhabditis belari TaxID=2138241 RepID=A0AAF3EXQ5_9BILA
MASTNLSFSNHRLHFEDLPNELIVKIAALLPWTNIFTLQRASRRLYRVLNGNQQIFPKIFDYVSFEKEHAKEVYISWRTNGIYQHRMLNEIDEADFKGSSIIKTFYFSPLPAKKDKTYYCLDANVFVQNGGMEMLKKISKAQVYELDIKAPRKTTVASFGGERAFGCSTYQQLLIQNLKPRYLHYHWMDGQYSIRMPSDCESCIERGEWWHNARSMYGGKWVGRDLMEHELPIYMTTWSLRQFIRALHLCQISMTGGGVVLTEFRADNMKILVKDLSRYLNSMKKFTNIRSDFEITEERTLVLFVKAGKDSILRLKLMHRPNIEVIEENLDQYDCAYLAKSKHL